MTKVDKQAYNPGSPPVSFQKLQKVSFPDLIRGVDARRSFCSDRQLSLRLTAVGPESQLYLRIFNIGERSEQHFPEIGSGKQA